MNQKSLLSVFLIGCILTSMLAVMPVSAKAFEAFENGMFDDGTDGWDFDGDGWEVKSSFDGASGNSMYFKSSISQGAAVSQTVEVERNKNYIVSFSSQGGRQMQASVKGIDGTAVMIGQSNAQKNGKTHNQGRNGIDEAEELGLYTSSWWGTYEYYFNSGDNDEIVFGLKDAEQSNFGEARWFDNFKLTKRDTIINGSFESSVRGGYEGWINGVFNVVTGNESRPAADGNKYGSLWGGGSTIYQPVHVTPNTYYELSLKHKIGEANKISVLGIGVAAQIDSDGLPLPGTAPILNAKTNTVNCSEDWTEYKVSFNSGDNTVLNIALSNQSWEGNATGASFDDVKLIKIAPSLEKVYVDGAAVINGSLKAEPRVTAPSGWNLSENIYRWQNSNEIDGIFNDIQNADSKEYTVKKSDKYIRVGVTPVCEKDGEYMYGTEVFSDVIAVRGQGNTAIDLADSFNGTLIGGKDEAQSDNINGYILNRDKIAENLNESNALECDGIWYGLSLYGDKRTVRSSNSDMVISVKNQNFNSLNVLMTYTDIPEDEQKAIINYADGTSETITYNAGSINELSSGVKSVLNEPIGMYGADGDEVTDKGFLYSYTFNTNPELAVDNITFPGESTEDKLIIFAVTGKAVSGDVLKTIIENRIAALPKTITANNRKEIEAIEDFGEQYRENGGNPDEITGYSDMTKLLIDVKNCTFKSGLYDFTIDLTFTNNIKSDSLTYDSIKIDSLNETQYSIEPIGDNAARIKIINYFDYPAVRLTVGRSVCSAYEPNFDLGYVYSREYTPEKLFAVSNIDCKAESGILSAAATVRNNGTETQSCYIVCAVYSENNEMLTCVTKSSTLQPGAEYNYSERRSFDGVGKTVKMFVWNNSEEMKLIYHQ